MDDPSFKSVLTAHDSSVPDDTSLALPADLRSSTQPDEDRNQRVHRQVKLTMSRKSKKTQSNGGVYTQKYETGSFDDADGLVRNMNVNRLTFSSQSFSGDHEHKPSRRLEVSAQSSPEQPYRHFKYSTYHSGIHTPPGPSHSPKVNRLTFSSRSFSGDHERDPSRRLEVSAQSSPAQPHRHFKYSTYHSGIHTPPGPSHSPKVGTHLAKLPSFHHNAFSVLPRSTQRCAYTPARGTVRQRTLRQIVGSQSVSANTAFQKNREYGSLQTYRQSTVKPTVQRRNGNITFDFIQPEDGSFLLGQLRERGHKKSLRVSTYSPSLSSVETDAGRRAAMQAQNVTKLRSVSKTPMMTVEKAVQLLTQNEEQTLIYATTFIQNQCFKSAVARHKICRVNGIEKLLYLLNNDSEEVQRATAGALRNAVYENDENKLKVEENKGLSFIPTVLNSSRDKETRRQLTGLLWNLSSHDTLKEAFPERALSTLSRSVLVPGSGIFEGENPKDELLADDETFINATGCLRNLSSAGQDVRKAMRNCDNLIDSLVYYIRGTVANRKMDDKPTENCVCILHNLSYQIESELPKKNDQVLRESRQDLDSQPKTPGCFSYRSAKITEYAVHQHPLLEPNPNPHGIEWLWDIITVRMYKSLMACSKWDTIKEAALGALQNITAGKHEINGSVAVTIVQRENGLKMIKEILNGESSNLKITAVSLIKNLSRYDQLRPAIANQVLPEMVKMLPFDGTDVNQTSEVTISLCEILTYVCQSDAKNANAIIEKYGIPKIINISKTETGPTRMQKAACLLLHVIWQHNEVHETLKKWGFKKCDFVNSRIKNALSS
ncbi:plakophilin-2 isoform X1 [Oreochromis niloticus]|uniref:Plakophilin 2 n=1 Tax=Oreochromis niloticus TaxID=8128 RepID=A0A669ENL3_ORENI|nr:plakophilin-2 isoform X1 [Oreochromis niloticus]